MGCRLSKPKILRMPTDPANLPTAGDAPALRQPKVLGAFTVSALHTVDHVYNMFRALAGGGLSHGVLVAEGRRRGVRRARAVHRVEADGRHRRWAVAERIGCMVGSGIGGLPMIENTDGEYRERRLRERLGARRLRRGWGVGGAGRSAARWATRAADDSGNLDTSAPTPIVGAAWNFAHDAASVKVSTPEGMASVAKDR